MTNQEQDKPLSIERLPDILGKIGELTQTAADGDHIYRGEPKLYPLVSSKLYRQYEEIEAERFDIAVVQTEILEEAKRFIRQASDDDILTQLQHYGYPTNLIDFTTDYNIALFFACDSQPGEDGRVILLRKADHQSLLREPKDPENRVIAQRSIFVESPAGFVEPSNTVVIPKDLKASTLKYLDKYHGVNASAVFNDIHGFIRYYTVHQSAYVEFHAGLTYGQKGEYAKAIEHFTKAIELNPQLYIAYGNRGIAYRRRGDYMLAIKDYDMAIELNPTAAQAYNNRGVVYREQGNYRRAIQDFNTALELNSDIARAYWNRGSAFLFLEEWENAEADLSHAQSLEYNIAPVFSSNYGSVEEFEQKYSVNLPENIKTLLASQQ